MTATYVAHSLGLSEVIWGYKTTPFSPSRKSVCICDPGIIMGDLDIHT